MGVMGNAVGVGVEPLAKHNHKLVELKVVL
jgi:hypothetical protein